MFKKVALAAALATLSFSVFAQGTLNVWEDIQKSKGITQAVADFEKQYDVKVNIKELPYAQHLERLRLDGPAGIGPDVLMLPSDMLGVAVVQGLIAPIKADKKELSDYTDASLSAFTTGGKIYGYPKVVETLVLIYNKALLKEPLKTTDDYMKFAKELQSKDKSKYGFIAKFDQVYYSYGAMSAYGGYIFKRSDNGDYDPTDLGINNQGSIDAINYLKTFFTQKLIPNGVFGDNGLNAIDTLFTEGKAAAVINGPWALEPYKKAGIDYGVTTLPLMPNGKQMSSLLGVKGYAISTYSKQKDLAEKFIQFVNQPQYAKQRFEITGEIPPLKSLMNDKVITENEAAKAIANQSEIAVPMPSIPEMAQVWTPVDSAIQLSLSGKQDTKEALDNAAQQINDAIEAFRSGMQCSGFLNTLYSNHLY